MNEKRYKIKYTENGVNKIAIRKAESVSKALDKLCDQYGWWGWNAKMVDAETGGNIWIKARLNKTGVGYDYITMFCMEAKPVYEAKTTYPGADGPSTTYFTDKSDAEEFISKQENGTVEKTPYYAWHDYDNITWDSLTHHETMRTGNEEEW